MIAFLTGKAREVAEGVIATEGAARHHVVVTLSGSHAYGFPSPDSDLDLKAIHIAPTRALLGLSKTKLAADFLEFIDGVEVDYTSNELGPVVAGVLVGNGNYIERVLGPLIAFAGPELAELVVLARGALSRRTYNHYRGFASAQRKGLEAAEAPRAKQILYVLRTALTGIHLLATGELVTDVARTAAAHGIEGVDELIAVKLGGERTALAPGARERWTATLDRAFDLLDRAREGSSLPEEPSNEAEIEDWLIGVRRYHFSQ